jgi:hypothetical protein
MSFVNEIAFRELVNDLRVDEDLVVDGTATISNLTAHNLTVTGDTEGVASETTFLVSQGDDEPPEVLTLVEKIALIDGQITANGAQASVNAASLVNKTNKFNPIITFDGSSPTYITFQNVSAEGGGATTLKALLNDKLNTATATATYSTKVGTTADIAASKLSIETAASSIFDTITNVDAKFEHPTFNVDDSPGLHVLQDITMNINRTTAFNGVESSVTIISDLKAVLDELYATKIDVAADIQTVVTSTVVKEQAEVKGSTLASALKIILPDPYQPFATTETNLQELLDAKPEVGSVYSKLEIDGLMNDKQGIGSYATTNELSGKQDAGSYATHYQ